GGEMGGGDESRIGVGDDDNKSLRGAEDAIDADIAEKLLLGERYKDVPGTADFVDSRDGLGAVRHRGGTLHSAGAKDAVDAGDFGGDELERGDDAVGGYRGSHDDFGDAGDAGGDH